MTDPDLCRSRAILPCASTLMVLSRKLTVVSPISVLIACQIFGPVQLLLFPAECEAVWLGQCVVAGGRDLDALKDAVTKTKSELLEETIS